MSNINLPVENANLGEPSKAQPTDNIELTSTISQLQPDQIDRLRDAYQLIDKDNDGDLSTGDIKSTYKSIGKEISEDVVMRMIDGNSEDGKVGFPAYLSIMAKQLSMLPNNSEITRALQVFSKDMEINAKDLKQSLLAIGMKEDEINPVLTSFQSERMNGETMFVGSHFLNHVSS